MKELSIEMIVVTGNGVCDQYFVWRQFKIETAVNTIKNKINILFYPTHH